MAKTDTRSAALVALRDFTDAGTGKSFEQGKAVDASEGEIGNYVAAGLMGPKSEAQQIIDDSHTATA